MKPIPSIYTPPPEGIPEDCLAVDLIHRAVKRLYEGEQGEPPVAPQVKIINFSIGDKLRQFLHGMRPSPIARLLDWLSAKYDVLFIVSAGNHDKPIALDLSRNELESAESSQKEAEILKALYRDMHNRKILSPAESINALTVGAAHYDASQVAFLGNRFDPFEQVLPSPISAFGSGYNRAVKPDILFPGGRQYYKLPLISLDPIAIEPATFRIPPGNKSASPGTQSGDLTATSYSCGTSNATALITHAAGRIYDSLLHLLSEQDLNLNPSQCEASLLKAMLVHGCFWNEIDDRIRDVLRTPDNGRQLNGLACKWLGYGIPQIDRVLDCSDQRATLLGFGMLSDGEAHIYRLPLPPSLSSTPEWRRLIVTLAWLSPISANTQKYRTANLWFELHNNELANKRSDVDARTVKRGTLQHEVFEGKKAEPFFDGDVVEIKVNCREDAGNIQNPVPYGLVVTLEVSEEIDIAIYEEIRTRIAPTIQIQQSIEGHID